MSKILFIILFLFISYGQAKELEKISVQFHWLDQFEFAGYYIAKEKGFYKDIGLDVELKNYKYGMNVTNEVLSKRATYAVGGSDLIINISKKAKIKLLFATFQSSPLVLLTTPKSGIKTLKDFKGKRIMITPDAMASVTFNAMMKKENINISDLIKQQHSFDVNDLINQKTDLLQSYISNEPYALKKQGIKPIIFDPKDYGFDLYSDIVFTSEYEIKNHKQRAINFKNATLKGWQYAFNNIEETVDIMLKKYNSQNRTKDALIYEAQELKKLALIPNKPLGDIDINKIQRIFDAYNIMNLVHNQINLNDFICKEVSKIELTLKEKEYLLNHPTITVHNETNWKPFNFNIGGKPKGYSISYMNLLAQKLGINIKYISGPTWSEFIDMIKNKKLDVMLNIIQTEDRLKYLTYTTEYKIFTHTIYSKDDEPYDSLEKLYGKTIALVKGFSSVELIRKNHPKIKILELKDESESFEAVSSGKAEALVSLKPIANSMMSDLLIYNLIPTGKAIYKGKSAKTINLSIATHKDNKILKNILQKAMDSLTYDELQKIEKKWFAQAKGSSIKFTQKEKNYLYNKQEIKLCIDPTWMPFEAFNKNGKHIGLSADYFDIFKKHINIPIKVVKTKNWEQTLKFVKNRNCDILSLAMETPSRKKYLNFTSPYLETPLVLVTKLDKYFVDNFQTLTNEKIGIPKGYAFIELLKVKYPNLNIIEVDNVKDGLQKVVDNKLFGYIGTLASVGYLFQKEFSGEVKIAGKFDEKWKLGVAVRNDDSTLLEIFEKLINNIDESTKQKILNNWITIKYEKEINYELIWKIIIGTLIIFLLFAYRYYLLNVKVKREIEKSRKKDNLIFQQNKMASLGNMIATIAHQWRQPLSELSMSQNMILRLSSNENTISKEQLQQIVKDEQKIVQFMSSTINTFQDFYKDDLEIETYNISIAYDNVKYLLNETIVLNNIKLTENIDKNINYKGCKNCLSQIILSILQNSIYFLKYRDISNPTIIVSIKKVNENIQIELEDNANGINDEIINDIFNYNFSQRDNNDNSTGLGLYISKLIIEEKFNGDIQAINTKNGVKFTISFPIML